VKAPTEVQVVVESAKTWIGLRGIFPVPIFSDNQHRRSYVIPRANLVFDFRKGFLALLLQASCDGFGVAENMLMCGPLSIFVSMPME